MLKGSNVRSRSNVAAPGDGRTPHGGTRGRPALRFGLITVLAVLLWDSHAAPVERANPAAPQKYFLRWTPGRSDKNEATLEVSGLSAESLRELRQSNWKPPQWQRLLSVFARQADSAMAGDLPPMLGTYRVESGLLRFEPQFPLEPGVNYRAILRPDQLPGERGQGGGPITADFQAPPRRYSSTTVVSQIYPSADILPENLLKFYLHFSAPMSRGRIYDHIHLRDESGKEVELPFLEIDEELWDPSMKRLTLFIDPGRIKRGVRPLDEVGPALQAGKRYTLVIDRAWQDGTGNPMKETFRKAFKVGPPDREPPDPARWIIQAPKSETRGALTIIFPKPMDHALAQRVIRIRRKSGEHVEGRITLEDQERRWAFIPTEPWRSGPYRLVVQTTLEDLAGNNIGKSFDVDVFENVESRLVNSTVELSFQVR